MSQKNWRNINLTLRLYCLFQSTRLNNMMAKKYLTKFQLRFRQKMERRISTKPKRGTLWSTREYKCYWNCDFNWKFESLKKLRKDWEIKKLFGNNLKDTLALIFADVRFSYLTFNKHVLTHVVFISTKEELQNPSC